MSKAKNVVLITIDCLREDRISLEGGGEEVCPFLNSLARKGKYFSNFFINDSGTPRAFQTIFSSSLISEGGIGRIKSDYYLPKLIQGVKRGAFQAGNAFLTTYYGYHKGFDVFEDYLTSDGEKKEERHFGDKAREFIRNSIIPGFFFEILVSFRSLYYDLFKKSPPYEKAEKVNRDVRGFIRKNKNQDFFLWIHYMDVHTPYELPNNKFLFYKDIEEPMANKEKKMVNRYYNNELKYLDSQIKNLFNFFEKLGLLGETVFIITSDHGEELGARGGMSHGGFFEEGVHIPLIIYSKDLRSEVINDLRDHLDIAPTILNLLGVKKPKSYRGYSLLKEKDKEYVIGQSVYLNKKKQKFDFSRPVKSYLRTNKWKYIYYSDEKDKLYNLEEDPNETNNLVDDKKEIASKFLKIIKDRLREKEKEEVVEKIDI